MKTKTNSEALKRKFKKSPKGNPIDWSGKTGIYLYSEWFVYSGYEGGGAWVHTYRDVEGEKASNAFWNAKADCEEIEFNRKMGIAS